MVSLFWTFVVIMALYGPFLLYQGIKRRRAYRETQSQGLPAAELEGVRPSRGTRSIVAGVFFTVVLVAGVVLVAWVAHALFFGDKIGGQ